MPDMREGDLGTAACYLTVERLALQAGVESPFWDEASLLMGGCEEPWYKKPLTPRRLRSFLKRYGGSLPDDAGRRGHAASVFRSYFSRLRSDCSRTMEGETSVPFCSRSMRSVFTIVSMPSWDSMP